ncbi:MAG: FecR domain-containing protein, partial [Clostridiales bacterium]|nr:FecR domain-containing protein [Clostridiales bacterium]
MVQNDKSKMNPKTKIGIIAGIAVVVIAVAVVCIVFARNGYLATTMRLLRIEGTVNLEDSKGGTKPVVENLRFQSGDALNTGADGLATIGLDDAKIVTLDHNSRAEFKKKKNQLELNLTKGALFFNVTEKLKSDERFDIKTSTMTAGIRGTSGIVYYDDTDDLRETIAITDGVVEISATNPETGE